MLYGGNYIPLRLFYQAKSFLMQIKRKLLPVFQRRRTDPEFEELGKIIVILNADHAGDLLYREVGGFEQAFGFVDAQGGDILSDRDAEIAVGEGIQALFGNAELAAKGIYRDIFVEMVADIFVDSGCLCILTYVDIIRKPQVACCELQNACGGINQGFVALDQLTIPFRQRIGVHAELFSQKLDRSLHLLFAFPCNLTEHNVSQYVILIFDRKRQIDQTGMADMLGGFFGFTALDAQFLVADKARVLSLLRRFDRSAKGTHFTRLKA